jgi:trk system potassium uptake protein TrkH
MIRRAPPGASAHVIDFRPVAFVVGALLLVVAVIPAVPAGYLLLAGGAGIAQNLQAFLVTSAAAFAAGLPLFLANRKANFRLTPRQMYLLTVATWVVINVFCAIPFVFSTLELDFVDALFETVSGTTTTGSTILTQLDTKPAEILIWRAMLQWLGGIGIIVMVVAILPHLRVGGMRLFRSEASDKSEKITSRSRKVARQIGFVYVGL